MATISEQLRTAREIVRDPARWFKGGWAQDSHDLFPRNDQEFLAIPQVCMVTACAQASVASGDLHLDYLHEVEHDCGYDEEWCDIDDETGRCIAPEATEEAWPLENLLEGREWPAVQYLEMAAMQLYRAHPTVVNDDRPYGHRDVLAIYDLAIVLAEQDEQEEAS